MDISGKSSSEENALHPRKRGEHPVNDIPTDLRQKWKRHKQYGSEIRNSKES